MSKYSRKLYFAVVGTIFLMVATLHFLRVVNLWEMSLGDWDVPMYLSALAVGLAATLFVLTVKLGKE